LHPRQVIVGADLRPASWETPIPLCGIGVFAFALASAFGLTPGWFYLSSSAFICVAFEFLTHHKTAAANVNPRFSPPAAPPAQPLSHNARTKIDISHTDPE